ncbi:MAG: hypothetical protein JJE25_02320, partial [Bacteroidia bacterium]|nr:hypothetical protein [Bacteroidia bacterium]
MLSKKNSLFYFSCFALLLSIILTYSNHFHNSFHFDDSHTIQNNIFIRDLKNIPKFFTDATTFSSNPSNQSYRPIVSTTLAVGYRLSGDGNPFFFHLQNFWGFLIYTLLIYLFALKIFNTTTVFPDNKFPALFVAALFSLHPLAAETVNYIISRSDIISSVGAMAGLVLWLYFPQKRKYGIYLLPVTIAMLAKPSAAMFAPILLFTHWKLSKDDSSGKSRIQEIKNSVIQSLPAFVLCGALYLFIDYMTPKTWIAGGASRWDYLITQPYIILLYVRNFFFPFYLSADTDLSTFTSLAEPKAIFGFLFLVFLTVSIILTTKKKKYLPITIGLFWFLAALIPTSS